MDEREAAHLQALRERLLREVALLDSLLAGEAPAAPGPCTHDFQLLDPEYNLFACVREGCGATEIRERE